MTQLNPLRTRLARLRRRRQRHRWATAYTAPVAGLLAMLAAAMAADWLFNMSTLQRALLLVVCAAVVMWVVRRFTVPWLGVRESELDMALLVERSESIDSDLVAAIQFESPTAPSWGSLDLEQAVVAQVVHSGPRLNVDRNVVTRPLARRSLALLACLSLWALLAWLAPEHVRIFFARALFGPQHYPSRTRIEALAVNGRPVDRERPQDARITVAFGRPAEFALTCGGSLPASAEVQLLAGGNRRSLVPLEPEASGSERYRGELARLTESVQYRFVAGDAYTEQGQITVVPLPVAVQELEVASPSYAMAAQAGCRLPRGLAQAEVLEGSRVVVRVYSEKPLSQVTLAIEKDRFTLRPQQANTGSPYAREWILDGDSPLSAVLRPLRYQIDVVDRDGLTLEQPLEGAVQIRPDLPPRVAAAIVTRVVLPTARPVIHYRAIDDLALDRVWLTWEVQHADGSKSPGELPIFKAAAEADLVRDREAAYQFDLAPLKLIKGDKLEVRLKAADYRGPRPGQAAESQPLVFQVTDQQGILSMMLESDRLSAEQLKEMIMRQLGIGGAR